LITENKPTTAKEALFVPVKCQPWVKIISKPFPELPLAVFQCGNKVVVCTVCYIKSFS